MDKDRKPLPLPMEHLSSLARYEQYVAQVVRQPSELPLRCPCCGCKTLPERGESEICEVCYWEDDGQDEFDAEVVRGGPNGALSLSKARENYLRIGACEESMVANVRPPRSDEMPGTQRG